MNKPLLPIALASLLVGSACAVTLPPAPAPMTGAQPVFVSSGPAGKNPIIQSFTANPTNVTKGQPITFQVVAHDPNNETLQLNWSATGGTLSATTGQTLMWTPPEKPGVYTVMVTVTNGRGGIVTGSQNLTVLPDGVAQLGGPPSNVPASPTPQASAGTPPAPASLAPSVPASPTSSPTEGPSPMTSSPPSAGGLTSTISSLSGLETAKGWGALSAATGASTVYAVGSNSHWSATFSNLTDGKWSKVLDTSPSTSGPIAFDGAERYYDDVFQHAITKPDGSIVRYPLSLVDSHTIEVVGNATYIADFSDACIYRLDMTTGALSVLAGQTDQSGDVDGVGTAARFGALKDIIYDPRSNALYVADSGNRKIRKVTLSGEVTTVAGNGTSVHKDGRGKESSFQGTCGVTVDDAGNLYVSDILANLVCRITPDGNVTTIAGNGKTASIDGVGAAASFNNPTSLAWGKVDGKPVLYVADHFGPVRIVSGW